MPPVTMGVVSWDFEVYLKLMMDRIVQSFGIPKDIFVGDQCSFHGAISNQCST